MSVSELLEYERKYQVFGHFTRLNLLLKDFVEENFVYIFYLDLTSIIIYFVFKDHELSTSLKSVCNEYFVGFFHFRMQGKV